MRNFLECGSTVPQKHDAELELRVPSLALQNSGWRRSFLDGFSQDENGDALPWMTYPAIEFLQKNLRKTDVIFEFGCGASTLFFARKVARVISLETNKKWQEIISQKLAAEDLNNVELFLMEDGLTNVGYENFTKNFSEKFDLIVVDSLKRFECAKNSIDALKPDGSIILDDSERKNYAKIFEFFAAKNFTAQNFPGIAPGQLKQKRTTVFSCSPSPLVGEGARRADEG